VRRGRCFFHIGLGQGGKKGEEGDAPRRKKKFKFHDDSYFGDTSSNARSHTLQKNHYLPECPLVQFRSVSNGASPSPCFFKYVYGMSL
jgi:hypothetical protein